MDNNFEAMKHKQDTPKVGVGCLIFRNNKILVMLRQGSHKSGTWAVPGGHMDIGEEFFDTCKREIKEELDIIIDGTIRNYSV
jgi:ADP-ribose pyrophosphatase YjhB (NUDIX family)